MLILLNLLNLINDRFITFEMFNGSDSFFNEKQDAIRKGEASYIIHAPQDHLREGKPDDDSIQDSTKVPRES